MSVRRHGVLNALLGIVEQLLRVRLEPYTVGDGIVLVEDSFRATALFGHPLTNAALTGFVLFVLYRLRDPAARLAFVPRRGGGPAVVRRPDALMPSTSLCWSYWRRSISPGMPATEGLTYRQLTGGTLLIVLMLAGLMAAVAMGGLGQRITASLVWDRAPRSAARASLVLRRWIGWHSSSSG